MRKRSCSLVQATLLACGTIGLLTSLATAQQVQKSQPVKPAIAEQKAKSSALAPSTTPAGKQQAVQAHATGARPTGNEPAVQFTAPGAGGQAGGGVVVRGNVLVDDCSDAGIQTLSDGTYAFSIVGFGGTDVDSCAFNNNIDGWFIYNATQTGNVNFQTCDIADFDTVFSAFDFCGGTQLGCMDDGCTSPGFRTNWTFPVTAGSSYLIRISGYNGASGGGQFIAAFAPPPNCYDCQPGAVNENEADCGLSGSDDTNGGCNSLNNPGVGTSISLGDNVCGTTAVIANLTRDTDWYIFTLTEDTQVTWDVTAEFPVLVGFIAAPCPNGAFIPGTAFTAAPCTPVSSTACLAPGTYYAFVACSSFATEISCNGGEGSRYTASFTGVACDAPDPAANDLCENAEVIPGSPIPTTVFGTTTAATASGATCVSNAPDVFYSFTPDVTETYLIDTCGSSYDTSLAVYTDCSLAGQLACNDDFCGFQSSVTVPMTAGTTYIIRVGGFGTASGDFVLNLAVAPPPPECFDCPMGSIDEMEADCGLLGDFVNGGCNSEPPVFTSIAVGQTACGTTGVLANNTRDTDWYEFTLAEGTEVTWNVTAEFPVLVGFIAAPCPNGAFIPGTAFTAEACTPVSSTICLPAGTYYAFVACSTFASDIICNGGPGSRYTATLSGIPCSPYVPPNDDCNTAEVLTEGVVAFGDNTNANTTTVLDALTGCTFGGAPANNDVWYTFTPGTSDTYRVSTCGSALDTVLSVWDTCPGDQSFNMLACSEDFCGLQSQIDIALTSGVTYFIRVAGWNNNAGPFQVVVSLPPPPAMNDNCPGDVVTAPSSTPGSTNGQTPSGTLSCGSDSPDVFYNFTPTVSGSYTIDLCGSSFDTRLSVFADCPTTALIACNDDFCGLQSGVTVNLTAGTTYYIRVSAFGATTTGDFVLNISAPPVTAGACCVGNACSVQTSTDCANMGGTYLGDNTTCDAGNSYTVSATPNLAITDNDPAGVTSTITGSGGTITDLNVGLHITHTWQGDVTVSLTHVNSGTTVTLVNRPGNPQSTFGFSTDNYGTALTPFVLDDAAAQVYDTPVVPVNDVSGAWLPDTGPLSAFNGLSANSDWTLTVADNAAGDTGTLVSWGLFVNPAGPCDGPAFCDADWCQDGSVGVPDIFCFLSDWFANDPEARNYGGTNGVPAIFAFLSVWFATGQGPCTP